LNKAAGNVERVELPFEEDFIRMLGGESVRVVFGRRRGMLFNV